MKMVMIAYNEVMDMEVMEALESCAMKNYTKVTGAFGRGAASGAHLGNDIWPGRNNLLYVACEETQAEQLLMRIRELRKRLNKEGIKAFVMPVDDVT